MRETCLASLEDESVINLSVTPTTEYRELPIRYLKEFTLVPRYTLDIPHDPLRFVII